MSGYCTASCNYGGKRYTMRPNTIKKNNHLLYYVA